MPTVKKLVFANGVNIDAPVDLSLETATNTLPVYADDAAFVAENDLINGSVYLNTTIKAPKMYIGGVWRVGIVQENPADHTKTFKVDLDGCTTGADNVLDFNSTADRTYTFPDASGEIVLTLGAQEVQDKTVKNGFLDGTKIKNNALDVNAAGNLTVAASMGANTMTLGGSTSTISIPGNLTVSGTTTTVDTTNLDVKDKNILINKGGNDAVSEGSGITVDRTGTKGSLIYKSAAQNKFSIGDIGAEKDIATMFDITAANLSGVVTPANGGTGISNNNAATLTRSGNHPVTLTTTESTSLTLPGSGTLATTADITMANLTGTLVPSKGGTGVSNNDAATLTRSGNHAVTLTTTGTTGVTLPTTGTLATLAGTESLSAKTLVEPVIDNFAALNHETTPAAATAGTVRVYAKSDNKLYKMDSTGAEAAVGSGSGSGGVNYLVDWYDATKPVGTVSTVAANGNIVVSGSAPAVTSAWYADATSGAAAIASSSSTLLRGSANYLTALSGASTSGATFVQSAVFNIDGSDLGKPVTISFDVSGVTTADDWDIVVARYTVSSTTGTYAELIPVAGTVSSMTVTPGAQLPTGTTQFRGFFIPSATSTDVYAVRLRRRAGSTQIRVDSLTVGPQSLAQGAVVTAWQSYNPTVVGLGTVSGVQAYYRRNGDSIQVRGKLVSGTPTAVSVTFTLPSGLNLDSTKLSSAQTNILGSLIRQTNVSTSFPSTTRGPFAITEGLSSSSTVVYISISTNTSAGGFEVVTGSNLAASGDQLSFEFNAPISQWSSGTTTLADRAVEEYLSTTSFSSLNVNRGPNGAALPNTTPAGTFESISFGPNPWNTTWLSTDIVSIEVDPFGNGKWTSISGSINTVSLTIQESSETYIGLGFYFDGTNWVLIRGKYRNPNSTNGVWSSMGAGFRYRIKKVSSGAAVGYPVSARNIIGDTSGSVVPTGYVGETLTSANYTAWATFSATSGSGGFSNKLQTNGGTDISLTLGAGRWRLICQLNLYNNNLSVSNLANLSFGFSTDSGSTTWSDYTEFGFAGDNSSFIAVQELSQTSNRLSSASFEKVLDLSSSQTYYAKMRRDTPGAAGGALAYRAKLIAVRIA